MRISAIPHLYRNAKRWRRIIAVLSRYGLADWLSRLNVDFIKDQLKDRDGEALARHTRETRIRLALTDLGPTFIKLGQLLSTRPDLVGSELADELRQLQTEVPSDPPDVVRATVQAELGQPVEQLFSEFEDTPIASASIGQVHRARLMTGERVVVKVQHAHIEATVRDDLEVLAGLALLAEQIAEFKPYRPAATVAELSRTLRRELDFGREERNLQQFLSLLANNPTVKIPQPIVELCTSRVLTMELIEGLKLSSTAQLREAGFDLAELARRGAELYLQMIFTHGFYHADPHPGNITLLAGNVIGLLDFGMVGRIDERLREEIEGMLIAIVNRDVLMLVSIIRRVGSMPTDLDESAFTADTADFVGQYATQRISQFDLGGALNDMIGIIHRHRITLPAQVALLIKTLITLEGTAKMLSPEFSIMELMRPFHRKMVLNRLSPARKLRKLRRLYMELEHLAEVLPGRMLDILEQVQAGRFDVHLDHRGLGPSVNRLVLGMLASALFLGSSLLLSLSVPPVLFPEPTYLGMHKLSILGLLGCVTSLLVGLRLIRAIGKSGHLDRKE